MNESGKICVISWLAIALIASQPSSPAQGQDRQYEVHLGGYTFVPGDSDPELGKWKMPEREEDEPGLYMIQLRGATRQATIKQLDERRLKIVQYIHPYTYVVWGRPQDHRKAREVDAIRWVGEFQPGFRVARNLQEQNRAEERMQVLIYRGASVQGVIRELERQGARLEGQEVISNNFVLAQLTAPVQSVREMAQIRGVYSIQKKPTDGGLRSEMSSQINAGNTNGNIAVPGYKAWLQNIGVDGSGVIMANVDGGLDNDHPDLKNRLISCTGATCQNSASSNHGTHTAGIMAGDGSSSVMDSNGFLRGLGVAPAAQLVEQVYINFMSPAGMSTLMTESVRNGACISSNSWGPSGSPQGYDACTLQVDARVRDADPDKDGNESLLYVLAIMNGSGGTSSQGSPDEAKNIFTIGSTKMRNIDGSQILEIDDISSNSAHGPCLDGRIIPHMVAPGCRVDSTTDGGGHGLNCGTSMAAPQVSGAAALFVEKYRQMMSGSTPSAALIKASFIAVAKDLHGNMDADGNALGHPFDNQQGWGRMDLRAVLNGSTSSVQYFDDPKLLQDSGDQWTVKLKPADPEKPIRIMLAWTDAPGHGLGGNTPAWNNDLDLVVETVGKTYLGNVFGADGYSVEGASADGKNNTEGVFLKGGTVGDNPLTLTIKGANINSDGVPNNDDETDQDFALVCYNCQPAGTAPPPDGKLQEIQTKLDAIQELIKEIEKLLEQLDGGTGDGNETSSLDLDCDCDRTGQVEGSAAEELVEDSQSAIVINNCDRDGGAGGGPDNGDSVINGNSDRSDLEPLILRRQTGLAGASIRLQISGNVGDGVPLLQRVRVFGPDDVEVIGPGSGDSYTLSAQQVSQLATGDLTFLVEGLTFATSVDVTVSRDDAVEDRVRLEVAPFLLTPHVLPAKKNYVVEAGMPISQRYVQDFKAACNTAGVQAVVVHSGDIWMEDELTWGYTESPRVRMPVAMHMFRLRPLQAKIAELLGPDVGWFQPFSYPQNPPTDLHLNYGGNVEVTPPSSAHPFGCIYYGGHIEASTPQHTYFLREFDARLRAFFRRQVVQPVLELHTNWLAVGHIDELVSFVPNSNGQGVLVASSPKRAYELLSQLNPNQPLDSRYALAFNVATVGDMFTKATLQQTMEEFNREVDRRIFGLDHCNPDPQSVVGMLLDQLNLPLSSVLEVPTVFTNEHPSTWAAVALTPGVVNLSSMGTYSLLPEPFLSTFKTETESVLQSVGQTPLWIDNWGLYHVNMGEVHCGSNELRAAFSKKWWES